jgi:hypothetical protein
MNNDFVKYISSLQALEYGLSVFLFLLVITAYSLLLNDRKKQDKI